MTFTCAFHLVLRETIETLRNLICDFSFLRYDVYAVTFVLWSHRMCTNISLNENQPSVEKTELQQQCELLRENKSVPLKAYYLFVSVRRAAIHNTRQAFIQMMQWWWWLWCHNTVSYALDLINGVYAVANSFDWEKQKLSEMYVNNYRISLFGWFYTSEMFNRTRALLPPTAKTSFPDWEVLPVGAY